MLLFNKLWINKYSSDCDYFKNNMKELKVLHCVSVPSLTPLSVLGQLNADSSIMPSLLQPKHQDAFSLAPQRPLTTINPIGHSLHPNGAPTLKPSPVPRTIQAMPWEQRSLYNQ